MWRPDGWEARARIGVLTPAGDVGPESELRAMAPPVVGVHAARVPFGVGPMAAGSVSADPARTFVEPPHIDEAAALLAAAPVAAIGVGFTSSAYVIGAEGEAAMVARLEERCRVPVAATCAAAADGLRALGVERLALIDPPWFDAELNAAGARLFAGQGFEVVFHAPCGLPARQRSINPPELYDWVRAHVPESAQGVFVGGNGFRAVGVIEALEQDLGLRVVTANSALLWRLLRLARIATPVTGYGALFSV